MKPASSIKGSMLLEAAVGTGLLAALAVYIVTTTVASYANTTFAAYSCIADNYLANQVAYIEAAEIAADGALTMPNMGTNHFVASGFPLNATNTVTGARIFAGSTNYTATVRTSRAPVTEPLGSGSARSLNNYLYTVQVEFRYPSGSGTAIGVQSRAYNRSRSVLRYAP